MKPSQQGKKPLDIAKFCFKKKYLCDLGSAFGKEIQNMLLFVDPYQELRTNDVTWNISYNPVKEPLSGC